MGAEATVSGQCRRTVPEWFFFGITTQLLMFVVPVRAQVVGYDVYDLGDLGCDDYTQVWDLNDSGHVVGGVMTADCLAGHAFLWNNGVFVDLSATYPGGVFAGATAVAEGDDMVGGGQPELALYYHDGLTTPLPRPAPCLLEGNWYPRDINPSGALGVGSCNAGGSVATFLPSVYDLHADVAWAIPLLPDVGDGSWGEAYGVNDAGIVVGWNVDTNDYVIRAFRWQDSVLTEIENLLGGTDISADSINNRGLIVGGADTPKGSRAFSYDINTGVMTDLGTGGARGVNDRADAVGFIIVEFSEIHGILYRNGEVIDLHVYMPEKWWDSIPEAINNYGWIAGYAYEEFTDNQRGFLMVPLYAKGDYDGDEDVDLHDAGHFMRCYAAEPYQGPEGGLHVGCSVFDFDDDADLDLTDYAAFQDAFTGPVKSGW